MSHPECSEHEVFVGNITEEVFVRSHWKTKRLGNVAHSSGGTAINSITSSKQNNFYPMFVAKDEIRRHDPGLLKRIEEQQ